MSPERYKDFAENRRGRFDFDISETFEAGMELDGQEVKSVKAGRANLTGSYGVVRGGELWLLNASIPPYQPKNAPADYEPARTRRLLLRRPEIKTLAGKLEQKGAALVPLRMYGKKGLIKLELGLGRSRKAQDKRELIKKRDTEREMRRAVR